MLALFSDGSPVFRATIAALESRADGPGHSFEFRIGLKSKSWAILTTAAASGFAVTAEDREITRVERLVQEFGIGRRNLQRLFHEYVGVSPKWVIQRYRLHEAVERIASGGVDDWAELALELGYADQAHFIRDFRKLVGQPPARYAQSTLGDDP